jgi:hypothetical protein
MKRTQLDIRINMIKEVTPRFFWTTCRVCNNQFKKEPMSKVHEMYFCRECCPTAEDVYNKIW